jgi:hypothetical protein
MIAEAITDPSSIDPRARIPYLFRHIGAIVADSFALHAEENLITADPKDSWENVTAHTLTQAARTQVLCQALGLSEDIVHDAVQGAFVSDVTKRTEMERLGTGLPVRQVFSDMRLITENRLRGSGYSERVVRFAGACGHGAISEASNLVAQDELSDEDLAWLVVRYTDDYTIDDTWAGTVDSDGNNALDRRIDRNIANPDYRVLNEIGYSFFATETTFTAQRRVGHEIEDRLARELAARGLIVTPREIPQYVDGIVATRMDNFYQDLLNQGFVGR